MEQTNEDFYRSREWLDLRYQVLKEAGSRCKCCGHGATPDNPVQVDHIKPRSKYPELALAKSNMQVLCKRCNMGKSNKDETDWRLKVVDEVGLAVSVHMSPAERQLRQDLMRRASKGTTREERESAMQILSEIDKAATAALERVRSASA